MTEKQIATKENKSFVDRAKTQRKAHRVSRTENTALPTVQQQIGNRAVQRLLAQRSGGGDGSFELNDETAGRINRERRGGQSLDSNVQAKMSDATGQDFSGVRVHTGPESHALNESLSAKAFTTGHDIFFREGAYDPGSSSGQELLAHELTHVVQQSSGMVGGGSGRMTVNAPGDAYEQQADSVAKAVTSTTAAPTVQRQELTDDEEDPSKKQRQAIDDEDIQMKAIQRDDASNLDEEGEE